jgi:fimbrial isopeptide formation D2 family protein
MLRTRSSTAGAALAAFVGLVALMVLFAPGGATVTKAAPASTGSEAVGAGPAHWTGPGTYGNWGKLPERPAVPHAAADDLMNPGNGEIMPTTHTHVIFWLPPGYHYSEGTTPATDVAYENQIVKYFQDVGGSQILNTTTQYPGNNGSPADTSNFVGSVLDTTAFPHAGTSADPVTQLDLNAEVYNQIVANSWPLGMSDMYFIFLPNNVVDCNHAPPSADCNTNKYCAYHTYGYVGSDTPANDFVWSDVPDNLSVYSIGGCGSSNVTGNPSADTTLSSVEHEHLEAVTDPRLNAWMDSTGAENGDKCNRDMGVANGQPMVANNYLGPGNADKFRIQREWSNKVSACAASLTSTGSFVESPAPAGGDVTKVVAEATIAGNPADSLTYTLTFTNPSNQDDAYNLVVTDTLPAGVEYLGLGTATFNLGDLAPHQTATKTFVAHPAVPLTAGATLTNTATFAFDDSTGTAQPTITRTASTTVVNAPPILTVPGPQTQDYHDSLSFGVSATDADAGDTLQFSALGLPNGLTLTDNGDRTATVSGIIDDVPGVYTATISVTDQHNPPVSDTVEITVTREETTTTYTGPTVIAQGFPVTLTASLLEDGTTAPSPSGQSVTLSVGSQSCVGSADASGDVSCTIPNVTVALGPQPLSAVFAGDTYYLPSSDATQTAIVFAFLPGGGAFALGDGTASSATSSTTVTFWGAHWSTLNSLTGGSAPADFKGFAGTFNPTTPTCGGTWTARPGDSGHPPAGPLPAFMGVVVTSSASKSGSAITGDIAHVVVVETNPGYAADPGHAGTGTIVATFC